MYSSGGLFATKMDIKRPFEIRIVAKFSTFYGKYLENHGKPLCSHHPMESSNKDSLLKGVKNEDKVRGVSKSQESQGWIRKEESLIGNLRFSNLWVESWSRALHIIGIGDHPGNYLHLKRAIKCKNWISPNLLCSHPPAGDFVVVRVPGGVVLAALGQEVHHITLLLYENVNTPNNHTPKYD